MSPETTVVLPAEVSACRLARLWTQDRLAPLGLDPTLCQDIVLCVSELVANAVQYSSSSPVLSMSTNGEIVFQVEDTSSEAAAQSPHPDIHGGRGLHLVDQIADRWGSTPKPTGGKRVWFAVAAGA